MSENQKHMIPGINSADLMKKIMEDVQSKPVSQRPVSPKTNTYHTSKIPGITASLSDISLLNSKNQQTKPPVRKLKGLGEPQRSDVVKEVLESPPAWLIRWGSTWVLVIIAMILAISWFVQYPDLVKGAMQVTGTSEASAVMAQKDGVLEELFVKETEHVEPDQIVGRLESLADPEEVKRLSEFLKNMQQKFIEASNYTGGELNLPVFNHLGELQQPYQVFANRFQVNRDFGNSGLVNQKIEYIQNDLNQLGDQLENYYQQKNNYLKDYQLAAEEYQNQLKLSQKGLISKSELRASESKLLTKKQIIDQSESTVQSIRMQENQKKQEILELRRSKLENGALLKQEVDVLLQQIESWERQHYLRSLTRGNLFFHKNIQLNQQVTAGQPLFYVMPDTAAWYGQMAVGQYNIGKVAAGQRVILKFQGYPYQEFGSMEGIVSSVSDIPVDSVYLIRVKLPENLSTSTGKRLNIRSGMTAEGEIVTEELRLIEKVFYEIRRYLKR